MNEKLSPFEPLGGFSLAIYIRFYTLSVRWFLDKLANPPERNDQVGRKCKGVVHVSKGGCT